MSLSRSAIEHPPRPIRQQGQTCVPAVARQGAMLPTSTRRSATTTARRTSPLAVLRTRMDSPCRPLSSASAADTISSPLRWKTATGLVAAADEPGLGHVAQRGSAAAAERARSLAPDQIRREHQRIVGQIGREQAQGLEVCLGDGPPRPIARAGTRISTGRSESARGQRSPSARPWARRPRSGPGIDRLRDR